MNNAKKSHSCWLNPICLVLDPQFLLVNLYLESQPPPNNKNTPETDIMTEPGFLRQNGGAWRNQRLFLQFGVCSCIPFLGFDIHRCFVKSELTPRFVCSVSMLKPLKAQISTRPQLRQLPVLKGFAVFLACSSQSSWPNFGVSGDMYVLHIYIYTHHV